MRTARSLAAMAFAIPLIACAPSLSQMRAQTPYHVEEFSVPPTRLADCAQNILTLRYGSGRGLLDNTYSFSKMTDGETIHLLAQIGEIPMSDLAFVSTGNGGTRVEARPSKNIAGDPNYPSDMWQTLRQSCSK